MRLGSRIAAALAALALSAACGGRGPTWVADTGGTTPRSLGAPLPEVMWGTWSRCDAYIGGTSKQTILDVTASSVSVSHLTFDGSLSMSSPCTGPFTSEPPNTLKVGVGDPVAVAFGGGTVQALPLDESSPTTGAFFDLVYVDEGPDPGVLYLGDTLGANDGTQESLRPTALDLTAPFTRQP